MSELELKHIAPYLPYGLKWRFDSEDVSHEVIGLDITDSAVKLLSPYNDNGSCNLKVGKPLLRPLSDLYKEINDKVGIVELAKMWRESEWGFDEDSGICETFIDGFEYDFWFNESDKIFEVVGVEDGIPYTQTIPNTLEMYEWLFANHYDVFGLISKGLAVDINKIEL